MESLYYGKEPANLKLLMLRSLKKIYLLPIAVLICALLSGGIYIFQNRILTKEPIYQADGDYYLFLAETSPGTTQVFYNEQTWNHIIYTDEFLNVISETVWGLKGDENLSKEIIAGYYQLKPVTDPRMLSVVARTTDSQLSIAVAQGFEKALSNYVRSHAEFIDLEIQTSPKTANQVQVYDGTIKVGLVGGILGGILFGIFGFMILALNNGIFIPDTFEERYQIPVLGTLPKIIDDKALLELQKSSEWELIQSNIKFHSNGFERIIFSPFEKVQKWKQVEANFKLEKTVLFLDSLTKQPSNLDLITKEDGVVLLISYGVNQDPIMKKTIAQLQNRNINILGALLCESDEKLLKRYYNKKIV